MLLGRRGLSELDVWDEAIRQSFPGTPPDRFSSGRPSNREMANGHIFVSSGLPAAGQPAFSLSPTVSPGDTVR